jgi:hypothetical protein
MGERVVIRDEPPLASEAPPSQEQGVPLGYGRANRASSLLHWLDLRLRMIADAFKELFAIVIPALGGARQVAFALGLAFVLGGFGSALGRGEPAFWMWLGGLLIGFSLRLPWLKGDRS